MEKWLNTTISIWTSISFTLWYYICNSTTYFLLTYCMWWFEWELPPRSQVVEHLFSSCCWHCLGRLGYTCARGTICTFWGLYIFIPIIWIKRVVSSFVVPLRMGLEIPSHLLSCLKKPLVLTGLSWTEGTTSNLVLEWSEKISPLLLNASVRVSLFWYLGLEVGPGARRASILP